MKSLSAFAVALSTAAVLSACGGGGTGEVMPPINVANKDTTLAASPTTTAAVTNIPFSFAAGVAEFGTTTATTLTFTNASATPAFSISSGGNSATGTTTFGSCLFAVTQSTFQPPSPLTVGQVIRVHPCEIDLNTSGQTANGQAQQTAVQLVLANNKPSDSTKIAVTISSTGEILVNGKSVGSVTLAPVTGS